VALTVSNTPSITCSTNTCPALPLAVIGCLGLVGLSGCGGAFTVEPDAATWDILLTDPVPINSADNLCEAASSTFLTGLTVEYLCDVSVKAAGLAERLPRRRLTHHRYRPL
jgi:hypothetical protein